MRREQSVDVADPIPISGVWIERNVFVPDDPQELFRKGCGMIVSRERAMPKETIRQRWGYRCHQRWAAKELLELFKLEIRAVAVSKTNNSEMADAAVQDFSAKICDPEVQEKYDPERPWWPWGRKILTRLIIDKHRKNGRENGRPAPGVATKDPVPPPEKARTGARQEPEGGMDGFENPIDSSPSQRMEILEFWDDFNDCKSRLPLKVQMVLYDEYELNLTIEQSAQRRGRTKGSINMLRHKGKQLLKKCMEDKGHDGAEP